MKIGDYTFYDNIQLQAFKDDLRNVWNLSKYQKAVVSSVPNWAANTGEQVLFRPASGGTTEYVYLDTAWVSTWSINL